MWLPQVQWHSGNLGILTDGNNCVYRNRFQDRVKTEMQDRVKSGDARQMKDNNYKQKGGCRL